MNLVTYDLSKIQIFTCPRCQTEDGPHSFLVWCDAYQQWVCEDHWVEGLTPYWGYWGA